MNLYGALTTMADNPLSYGNNGLTKGFGELTNPKWPNNNRYDWNINFLSSTAGDFPLEIRLESTFLRHFRLSIKSTLKKKKSSLDLNKPSSAQQHHRYAQSVKFFDLTFKEAAVCLDDSTGNILLSCCLSLGMVFHWCRFLTDLIMVTVDHDLEVITHETALPTWHHEDKEPVDQSKINLLPVIAWNLSFVKLKIHPVSSQTLAFMPVASVHLGFPLLSSHWRQKGRREEVPQDRESTVAYILCA